jgi:CheY-like chemotaxis protein
MNLVINAREAMLEGGRLTIETANVDLDEDYARKRIGIEPGLYVMLAVSDTGTGMDADTISKIFEPFFTSKAKGTGLGLSTVFGIIKQSGGDIQVYSEPGQGTTFKVYLPRIEGERDATEVKKHSISDLRGSETVLVVEDDEALLKLITRTLTRFGYAVLGTSSGEAALDACERHGGPVSLMLTDVVMPQMSGRELARLLVARIPDMKVLYMSGYTDNAIVRHGVLEKGIEFIHKPFTAEAIVSRVREILDASGPDRTIGHEAPGGKP